MRVFSKTLLFISSAHFHLSGLSFSYSFAKVFLHIMDTSLLFSYVNIFSQPLFDFFFHVVFYYFELQMFSILIS